MDWRRVFFRCTILRHFLARPRGVLSETYRYEEISLFPKDLNENYHPSDFAEKVVDPKSFRNILTSTLGKLYVLCYAACGAMLHILAGRMRDRTRRALEQELRDSHGVIDQKPRYRKDERE